MLTIMNIRPRHGLKVLTVAVLFPIELLCLREQSWEFSNINKLMSLSVDENEIDDLLFAVLCC